MSDKHYLDDFEQSALEGWLGRMHKDSVNGRPSIYLLKEAINTIEEHGSYTIKAEDSAIGEDVTVSVQFPENSSTSEND